MKRKIGRREIGRIIRIASHIGAWLPLLWLVWQYQQSALGVDPVREIILRTGLVTLILLLLSLAVTPLMAVTGWKLLHPLRRRLGLYAFFYVCLHFTSFLVLDYGLQWSLIVDGIVEQRYVLVGFAAFLLLIPLALTSTKGMMRRLGKNWKKLHKLVYLAGILGIIHFVWLVKNVYDRPIIYGSILALLLLARIKPIKQRLIQWRRSLTRHWRRRNVGQAAATD